MKRKSCFKAIAFLLSLFPLPECIQSIIRLSVEVPPAINQECYGEVLDEFSKKAKVPGFRQGKKVPENILLNYIGRQNIQQAVVEATLKKTLPHAMSSFAYAGSSILGKLALGQGLSALVFVVYRHLIAMFILAPLAYVLERNRRPSFSFGVMLKIFILAMLGITIQQNVYYIGLHLISPTVASALGNVIPAFTFLLAIVLRMEKLNLKTVRGRAKLAGAIFCITGSLIFTFWKGHFVGGLCYFTYDPTSFRKS
ncbi:hypothetical protein ZIOFF_036107 [Zingiber officinale]|uniref:WAT1-related protein n=1 Tax=Zingiber officinale TaxID=94328 RepID=A0A8J5KYA6_ZINOF|nr:hypothetical protein ZIOFF_036107 [Zingiber officinale]